MSGIRGFKEWIGNPNTGLPDRASGFIPLEEPAAFDSDSGGIG
jgi:hypothetical protein